jgi:hypothetical protein
LGVHKTQIIQAEKSLSNKEKEAKNYMEQKGRTGGLTKWKTETKNGHRKQVHWGGGLQIPINVSISTQKLHFVFRYRPLLETHIMYVTYFSIPPQLYLVPSEHLYTSGLCHANRTSFQVATSFRPTFLTSKFLHRLSVNPTKRYED